jgi:hypothetical protein
MHDRAIDSSPAWSPDGKVLYFTSDRTGIYNLYTFELETRNLSQVTNVLGGAFNPAPSPDSRLLAFTSYSAKGFDVHSIAVDPASWKPAEAYRDPYPVVQYEEQKIETSTKPYSPLPTLAPTFWIPWYGYSHESGVLGGFVTFGVDAVERHQYVVSGLYGPKNGRAWYTLDYLYDGFSLGPFQHRIWTRPTPSCSLPSGAGITWSATGLQHFDYCPLIKTQTSISALGYRWSGLFAHEAASFLSYIPHPAGVFSAQED